MRLEVQGDQREVLLGQFDGILVTTAALYGQIGREWDLKDTSALAPDVALVVRARDQLAGEGPWHLEATTEELEFLLGRLRMAAELSLQRGATPSPAAPGSGAMNRSDADATDAHLDVLRVTATLMQEITPPQATGG